MDITHDPRSLLTVVNLCGSESAQVVATHVAHLVHRLAPDFRLRVANRMSDVADRSGPENTSCGYIFLLPCEGADVSRACQQRFDCCIAPQIPTLSLRIVDDIADAGPAGEGGSSLPELRISSCEARIEHGGRHFLERDTAGLLKQRLGDLLTVSRQSPLRFASSPTVCALPSA